MKKWVIANWKMQGGHALLHKFENVLNAAGISFSRLVLCPAYLHIGYARGMFGNGIRIGAQGVSDHESGAYTGQVSAAMLAEAGCYLSLVGHSECWQYCAETRDKARARISLLKHHGLRPLVCIGESLEERNQGRTVESIRQQIAEYGDLLDETCMLAYEPLWAIGTGLTPTSAQIIRVHEAVKEAAPADIPVLYGGSVNDGNYREILALEPVDGVLVGGASLKPETVLAMCMAA